MATKQIILVPGVAATLVGLEKNADIEMLDGGALETFKVLGPGVGTSAESGVDAVNDMASGELGLEEGDALVDPIQVFGCI